MRSPGTHAKIAVSLALLAFAVLASSVGSQSAPKAAAVPLEKRPYVLVVYADWCPYCQDLKPVLALINDKYRGRIRFVRYDVTTDETTAKSKELAAKLGLTKFFEDNQEKTSLVIILDASRHEVFRATSDNDAKHYETVLDQQLQSTSSH